MTTTRTIEVFSAGCAICEDTIALVNQLACPSCEVSVLDTREPDVAERAKQLGVNALPAVAIDGVLADCCKNGGIDEASLRDAGVGTPIT